MLPILVMTLLCFISSHLHAAEPVRLELQTDRPPSDVHPREDSLEFRILVQSPNGERPPRARLHIQLQAPKSPWLGSTDFPVVEGTTLHEAVVPIERGSHAFQFIPPIRGVYTLAATLTPMPGDSSFAPIRKEWQTTITESPARVRNLGVLLMILIAVGSISGFIFARGAGSTAGLVLLLVFWPNTPLKAHGSHEHAAPPSAPEHHEDDLGGTVTIQLLTAEPRVGRLAELTARYQNAKGLAKAARFQVQVTQLEHERQVFYTEVEAPDGLLHWQGQFYDGSPHRVTVLATPLTETREPGTSARAELDVDVIGVEPPLPSVIKSFGLLMFVTALALILGLVAGHHAAGRKGGLA
ncbi:hypothetical protein [Oligoflexus tunisiensis]|uniref:hypothetical protein n=1 Tax=Oligoflexus tunisiensis TaxID=708132 RepID=UPI00114D1115|nr:hypothetical protein [Oligoflexus tunisiensis]